jgi:NitT/TauT family transport system substrate-binding protein
MFRFSCLLIALLFISTPACSASSTEIRVGFFPNVTHAQALVAHHLSRSGKGWFEERLGPGVTIKWFTYNAGPSAMEAIFARSLDMTWVGPNPAINAHIRSKGNEIRIVAGSCSGGAALVVRGDAGIATDADFRGKTVASPQLGNTQDVAARAWMKSKGFRVTLTGGDVHVVPASNADHLMLFQNKTLDAAWTVEPWVSRLVLEGGGQVYLDEKSLWPQTGGRYVTTHLVSSVEFIEKHPDLLRKWIAAHVELTEWIRDNPAEARRMVNEELKELTTRGLSDPVLERAWSNLELTWDPVRVSLAQSAAAAHEVGFLKQKPDLSRIYELNYLNAVLRERNLTPVP